jgi:hypothetical protein
MKTVFKYALLLAMALLAAWLIGTDLLPNEVIRPAVASHLGS